MPPLICGEYWLLLVGSVWKPRPTPGMVAARFANCRPLSGMLSIRFGSTKPPTDDEVVSTSGDDPVTLTVSANAATFNGKSTDCVWATLTSMSFLDTVVKPGSSAVTSYKPTGSAARR